MKKEEYKEITNYFGEDSVVETEKFRNFILHELDNKKSNNLYFYLHDISYNNIAYSLTRNKVKISSRQYYKNRLSKELVKISKVLIPIIYDFNYCLWDTSNLFEHMNHQLFSKYIFLDVEEDVIENILVELQGLGYNVLLKPNKLNRDLYLKDNVIVLNKLIKNAPVRYKKRRTTLGANNFYWKNKKIAYPKIEKIMVDLFKFNYSIFDYEGELKTIFKSILKKYQVNFTTLLRYAKNRNKKEQITQYIESIIRFNIDRGEFYD